MKKKLRVLSLILLLVGYFCLLTAISYVRAPQAALLDMQPVLRTADFRVLEGAEGAATVSPDAVVLRNAAQGELTGCTAVLRVENTRTLSLQFSVSCSGDTAGGLLTVDLCSEGYDHAEQERQIVLEPGKEDVTLTIDPGADAPEYTNLRFFTHDRIDARLENITVSVPLPKDVTTVVRVSTGLAMACFLAAAAVFAVTDFTAIKNSVRLTAGRLKADGSPLFAALLVGVLFLPLLLSAASAATGKHIVKGFYGEVTKPVLTAEALQSGTWQRRTAFTVSRSRQTRVSAPRHLGTPTMIGN